jgi:DNA-binding CsgD family transcriptional regulator
VALPADKMVLRAQVRALLRVRRQYVELQARARDVDSLMAGRRHRLMEGAGLSERERVLLELILAGRGHREIAAELGISERTSKFHQRNILDKLGADSRADLLRIFA